MFKKSAAQLLASASENERKGDKERELYLRGGSGSPVHASNAIDKYNAALHALGKVRAEDQSKDFHDLRDRVNQKVHGIYASVLR